MLFNRKEFYFLIEIKFSGAFSQKVRKNLRRKVMPIPPPINLWVIRKFRRFFFHTIFQQWNFANRSAGNAFDGAVQTCCT